MYTIEEQKNGPVEPLNMWKSIWLHPRKTVRYAVQHKTWRFVIIIALISGIFTALDQASSNDLGDSMGMGTIALIALLAGPILGVISLYIGSGVLHLLSKMFGGRGTFAHTKMAYTVSNLILIVLGFVWLPDLLINGRGMFVADYDFSIFQVIWLVVSLFLNFALGVWATVSMIGAIAEVHELAIWKAVLVVLLPVTLLIIFIFTIVMLTVPFMLFS
ncbi:YIP1 family protein [Sporosarcina sp. Sa2YVA2]|uniref:YIP1 family protein n=1 Tax=Sporosarcina quadrami TaxID=2762234 RepID=A0ABR8U5I3_9BACL|nr:Yip1 family protein [Sporosarcina quadrami]MBD7983268.1 YIP1 family protein [Sporosarcina quadrami]